MIVTVYDSLTGQGKRFAEKIGLPFFDIQTFIPNQDHQVVLITRSEGFGKIPNPTLKFITAYRERIIGCAVGGNRSWGATFGLAGETIQKQYNIPLITKFEMIGFPHEVAAVQRWIADYQANQKH